jgi:hypothetical protein
MVLYNIENWKIIVFLITVIIFDNNLFEWLNSGPPREILQSGTRLLWGLWDKLRLLSKLRIWGQIKPRVNFQPEIRNLSEFYMIIFLNKLKMKKQNKIKRLWLRQWGLFKDSQTPSLVSGTRFDAKAEPPSYRPWLNYITSY